MRDDEAGGLHLLQLATGGLAGFDGAQESFGQRLIGVRLERLDHRVDDAGVAQDVADRHAVAADLAFGDRA